jgi:hypothetical protein
MERFSLRRRIFRPIAFAMIKASAAASFIVSSGKVLSTGLAIKYIPDDVVAKAFAF